MTMQDLIDEDENEGCWQCAGEGSIAGEYLDDPEMYDPNKIYTCPCCKGTGKADDCTYW